MYLFGLMNINKFDRTTERLPFRSLCSKVSRSFRISVGRAKDTRVVAWFFSRRKKLESQYIHLILLGC